MPIVYSRDYEHILKGDDRAYSIPEKVYKEILKPHKKRCPVLFVINQVDKINPLFDWDRDNHIPGKEQEKNIQLKILEIAKTFDVPPSRIQTASAQEKYNLTAVMDAIVDIVPKEKSLLLPVRQKRMSLQKKQQKQEKRVSGIPLKKWQVRLGIA